VKKVTKEDRWAVQLIDTYVQLESVKSRGLEREIAVFGDPFGMGILIKGIIVTVTHRASVLHVFKADLLARVG